MAELTVIRPPKEFFEDDGKKIDSKETVQEADNVLAGSSHAIIPPEGGVYLYTDGFKWPERGWPFKEAVLALDTIKRGIMNLLRFSLEIPFYIFRPSKLFLRGLDYFTDYTDLVFNRWGTYWKPIYYCTAVREIYTVGMGMASEDQVFIKLVKFICMLLEFDNAYRYRFQDLMREFNLSLFNQNPTKELRRVLMIAISRDPVDLPGTADRFKTILKLLPIAMRIKIIREGLISFFNKVDLTKLRPDEIDDYRTLVWGDYNFGGKTLNERLIERAEIDLEWYMSLRDAKASLKPKE